MGSPIKRAGFDRRTICFPKPGTQDILEGGSQPFRDELRRLYVAPESNALEALVELKTRLRTIPTDAFWSELTEGLSPLLGAEITFVMKRVLVDDHGSVVEMPPLGEPGSCLMAAAMHYCNLDGSKHTMKETKFHAYGCPCAYMRHDKVFLIPEALNDFIPNNPNQLPFPPEAYIGIPLFVEGKCIAHFGAMWSKKAAAERKMSWGFIEMIHHSLEDMIVQRLLEGSNFVRAPAPLPEKPHVIPHQAVTAAQSLRPYAGSLSHELRTPMQGVVGMLDVMYATVQEAVETQRDPHLRKMFENLKENIEVVQDSSRRAVEAADNVVHAYDMDMNVPDGPISLPNDDSVETNSSASANTGEKRPEILVAGSNLPLAGVARGSKRRREESRNASNSGPSKLARVEGANSVWARGPEPSRELEKGAHEAEDIQAVQRNVDANRMPPAQHFTGDNTSNSHSSRVVAPGLRHTNVREVIQYVINEGLKMGGRPDSAMAQETEFGESIEVRTRGSDGTATRKCIDWSVDPLLPETMFIDEKDLSKLVSCVFLNAIKFTDQVDGYVKVEAKMSSRKRYFSIKISDNGPGIPPAFLPKLFKPFSQENGSLTRQSEGLGLGLMVAKGLARKLGGDLMCVRAETEGQSHGSEFEIKVPVVAGETISRPSSPAGSPIPRRAHLANRGSDTPSTPQFPPPPSSPRRLAHALQEVVNGDLASYSNVGMHSPMTPPSPRTRLQPQLPRLPDHTSSPISHLPPNGKSHTEARPRIRKSVSNPEIDRDLANKYPLTFLVAEDNKINRKLLVSMLSKFGYNTVFEAHDGAEAVRQMTIRRPSEQKIDVVLMDLWMPLMDGYEATEKILDMQADGEEPGPAVLAVTADVTAGAIERAASVGMRGYLSKPFKLLDLQRLITEHCARSQAETESLDQMDLDPAKVGVV